MADSVVSLLLDTLSRLLGQEDDLLQGVDEKLRSFHGELSKISSVLREWEEKKDEKKATGLGRLISDVAYEAEDLIDTLAFNVSKQRTRSGLGKFVHGFGQSIMPAEDAAAATKIESFTKRIKEIENIYGIQIDRDEGGTESPSRLTETIGANEEETLVERLTMGDVDSPQLQVISITGLCGAGKTTLAKKIYLDESVKTHFSHRAWVHISQNCTTEDVLLKILKCVQRSSSKEKAYNMKVPNEQLKKTLSECLKYKRYLVVMDDIREVKVWNEIRSALPNGKKGCRILLTFQSESMASVVESTSCYSLRKLNPKESKELVQKIAFNESKCPKRLEKLVEQSAGKCEGFPLSLVLLGSFLARQMTALRVMPQHTLKVEDNLRGCGGDMLSFVYNKLPNHLSLCFLYLGMFPEGFEIPAKQLIQLWIAEGLIEEKGDVDRTLEDVGEEYLEELTAQSLIQVASRRTDGGVKTCCIPDAFRDFAISKGREKKFLEVQDILNYFPGPKTRRLAIHFSSRAGLSLPNFSNYLGVRSFHFSIQGSAHIFLPSRHWNFLYTGFKLLKVLNLGMVLLSRVPKEVGKVIHLRYLRIKAPSAKHVPASICNLLNLQTLDMRESYLSSLPNGIWMLEQLRHLHLAGLRTLPGPPGSGASDNKSLLSLHTLSCIRPDKDTRRLMIKWKFPNVRKLKLASQNPRDTAEFLESLDHLHHLHSLKIVSKTSRLPEAPDAFPSTLTKLTLLDTSLPVEDSMKTLEKLPNLQILKLLRNSIKGPEINCSESGFPKLQVLHMVELMEIQEFTMAEKALGSLQYLVLQECVELTMLPNDLWSVDTLRQVKVYSPSEDLGKTLEQLRSKKGRIEILVDPPRT